VEQLSRREALTGTVGAAVAAGFSHPTFAIADDLWGSTGPRVDHYATPEDSELIAKLTISSQKKYRFCSLYILKVPDLRKGDVVQAHAQFEITNDLGVPVQVAHAMLVHAKKTVVKDSPTQSKDRRLCEYAGEFLTPEMHHGFRTLMGSFQADAGGDAWVSVVIYAVGPDELIGRTLTVEKNYGGLRAIVFRNA
jgi:hypothetical protein